MRKLMISTAAIAAIVAGGSVIGSNQAAAACDLPNDNWTCEENTTTTTSTILVRINPDGGGLQVCKEAEVTTTTTTFDAVNPGGQDVDAKDGEPEVTVVVGDPSGPAIPGGDC